MAITMADIKQLEDEYETWRQGGTSDPTKWVYIPEKPLMVERPSEPEYCPASTSCIPDKFAYEAAPAIAATSDDNFVSRKTYAFLHNRYMLALDEVKGLRAQVAATAPDAAKLADEIMARIERDRDYHGASISRDALIDVAIMCGCIKN